MSRCLLIVTLWWCLLVCCRAASPAVTNSLFNPDKYPVITNSLVMTSGSISINTGNGGATPPTFRTVVGDVTNTYQGVVVTNQSGKVVLALYNFGSLGISNGVSCSVAGNLGVVLGAVKDIVFNGSISMNGGAGVDDYWGLSSGAPGADNGVAGVPSSNPPGSTRGNGGNFFGSLYGGTAVEARGCGMSLNYAHCPGGAGYGGAGGAGYLAPADGGAGGVRYGDSMVTNLYGGSGSGGSQSHDNFTSTGGAGGGAIEIVAVRSLYFAGTVRVNGGAGALAGMYPTAGGSAGSIVLAANTLVFAGSQTIEAKGGAGGTSWDPAKGSGGGGGGRIVFYSNNSFGSSPSGVSVAGGAAGGTSAGSGGTGTFRYNGDGQSPSPLFPFSSVKGTVLSVQ